MAKGKYVPGATWKDVMKGKPVLRGEASARRRAKPKQVPHRCRDCARGAMLPKRAGTVRCAACGGIVDPVRPSQGDTTELAQGGGS